MSQIEPEEADWVDLLGPASWWPDDYNKEEYRFAVPVENGHKKAFELLRKRWEVEPKDYELIFPSDQDLRMMEDSPEAWFINRSFL